MAGAIVLAGGGSTRMSGLDKVTAEVGGTSILERVLGAAKAVGADPVVVVGPQRAGVAVRTVVEDPPGGGPLAALAAGLAEVDTDVVVLLAGDLPFVDPGALAELLAAVLPGPTGAVAVDAKGRPQWLLSAWHGPALAAAVAAIGDPAGRPLRSVLDPLAPVQVRLAAPAPLPPWFDCDTPHDLAQARRAADGPAS